MTFVKEPKGGMWSTVLDISYIRRLCQDGWSLELKSREELRVLWRREGPSASSQKGLQPPSEIPQSKRVKDHQLPKMVNFLHENYNQGFHCAKLSTKESLHSFCW